MQKTKTYAKRVSESNTEKLVSSKDSKEVCWCKLLVTFGSGLVSLLEPDGQPGTVR